MIKSDILKIKKIENFDNIYIEQELSSKYNSIIRWAIVEITDNELIISVSYEM